MIHSLYLGRVPYADALLLQRELVALRTAARIPNVLLLLEHPPVLTLGRNASRSNILASDELLAARGIVLHEINRGGDVTYHGPGQLIGYPIFDLRTLRNPSTGARLGPVDFVRLMEEALIRLCADYVVHAARVCGLTGVWVGVSQIDTSTNSGVPPVPGAPGERSLLAGVETPRIWGPGKTISSPERVPHPSSVFCSKREIAPPPGARKIAAIGIHVARGVTSHGFAFNLSTDLSAFSLINPCGIAACPVTSLATELAAQPSHAQTLPSLESLAHRAALQFGHVLNVPVLAIDSLAALRALAQSTPPAGSESDSAHSEIAAEPRPSNDSTAAESPTPEFPGNDIPLTIPPEIDRLRGAKPRPVSA